MMEKEWRGKAEKMGLYSSSRSFAWLDFILSNSQNKLEGKIR